MPNTARLREELSLTDDVLARFSEKYVVHESGCWLWTAAKSGTGYGKFRVGKRSFDAHVISWRIANGGEPVPVGKLVMHSCDVRGCVNPAHLSIGSTSENMRYAYRDGRLDHVIRRGCNCKHSKLTPDLVREIWKLFQPRRFGARRIASALGVSEVSVAQVLKGQSWTHVRMLQ